MLDGAVMDPRRVLDFVVSDIAVIPDLPIDRIPQRYAVNEYVAALVACSHVCAGRLHCRLRLLPLLLRDFLRMGDKVHDIEPHVITTRTARACHGRKGYGTCCGDIEKSFSSLSCEDCSASVVNVGIAEHASKGDSRASRVVV